MTFDPKTASDADCELHIIRALVTTALSKGFTVSVYDGGAWTLTRSRNLALIMAALQTTDENCLLIRGADRQKIGVVNLIYGNQPWEVIADQTDTPKMLELLELLEPAEAAAKQIEEARS